MDHLVLRDKVAVITGSGTGIGKAIAIRFADEGAKVVVNYRRSEVAANETVQEIRRLGMEAIVVRADVSSSQDVERLFKSTVETFGKVDILVNNAGVHLDKPIVETTEEEWDRVLDINLKGTFLCSKAAIPHMTKQGKGRIVNVASTNSVSGEPNSSAYCASKGGMAALTMQLAVELGPRNITVNTIAPGIIDTPMAAFIFSNPALRDQVVARTPIRRDGIPSDVAEAALFFARDGTDYITGTFLLVDGGWMASQHTEFLFTHQGT